MMKTSTPFVSAVLFATLVVNQSHSWAQSAHTSRYDTRFMPITAAILKNELQKNHNDAVEMYALLFRADKQKLMGVAYRKMKALYGREPRNAVVAASYALTLDILRNNYGDSEREEPLPCPIADLDQRNEAVQRAFKLNPKLWLPYVVQGVELTLSANTGNVKPDEGRHLLQTAVRLAPQLSYTHLWLGFNYGLYSLKPVKSTQVLEEKEYLKSTRLKPITYKPFGYLITLYDVRQPNKAKLKTTALAYVKALQPGMFVKVKARQQLASYGAPVPWPNPKNR